MSSGQHMVYEFGDFRLEPQRRLLRRIGGEPLAVTGKAFDALVYLVEHAGALVTRVELAEFLWPSTIVEENNLSQAVSVLRRALGDGFITTIARRGYQFTAPVRHLQTDAPEPAVAVEPSPGSLAGERESAAAPPGVLPSGRESAAVPSGVLPSGRKSAAEPSSVRAGERESVAVPSGVLSSASQSRARRRAVLMAVAAGLALLAAITWLGLRSSRTAVADPLDRYVFSRLTEFEGAEEHAAISRDGRFVAFLREREGQWDAWVGQIGTDDFHNLTGGAVAELRNPSVRTLGFSPDGSQVTIWSRVKDPSGRGMIDAGWTVPTFGGTLQPYLRNIAELDWSPDGKRIAYHTAEAGDPMFVANADEKERGLPLHVSAPGLHSHFPLWSRDGRFIYFVHGYVPDEMDVWRVAADGAKPERLTFHGSRVSFPAWLDDRTLLYLATADDGSGPWLHAFDIERRRSLRLDTHGREYASIAASVDGRRIVATEVRSTASLWRASLRPDGSFDASDATRIAIQTPRGLSPRNGGDFIVYRAPRAGRDGIYKVAGGVTTELWSGVDGRVIAGPVLDPDRRRLAFPVQRRGSTRLYVMNIDGSGVRQLAAELDVRGSPSWSPDGNWIAIAAMSNGTPQLFRIPAAGGAPIALDTGYALDPAWSPSGRFIVFSAADVGTNFSVGAVDADGAPHALPPLALSRGSRHLDFLSEQQLVVLKGDLSHKELWVVDLRSGTERQLADLGHDSLVQDFDISDDTREIVFDRVREESDIVLMELPERPSQ